MANRKDILITIFLDVYRYLMHDKFNYTVNSLIINEEDEELRNALEEYIRNVLGYHVYKMYNQYINGEIQEFPYFSHVRKSFENILINMDPKWHLPIKDHVLKYKEAFQDHINEYPLSAILIDSIRQCYSKHYYETVISQVQDTYLISKPDKKGENILPSARIEDIKNLEIILDEYVRTIQNSDTFFNKVFEHNSTYEEALSELFLWTMRNASLSDLRNLEEYFSRYTLYFKNDSLDFIKNYPMKIGEIFNDELYVFLKKSTVVYETPYYLSFMLKDTHMELPNVRLGVEDYDGKKIANILAVQTSQTVEPNQRSILVENTIKKQMPKSKNFREFNPSHLASLVLAFGLLKGLGIEYVNVPDYLPYRYQRYLIEGKYNLEEIDIYQHRLTDKYMNNFFRLLEFVEDEQRDEIIREYPDMDNVLRLRLIDDIKFKNEFLQELYETTYKIGLEHRTDQKLKKFDK